MTMEVRSCTVSTECTHETVFIVQQNKKSVDGTKDSRWNKKSVGGTKQNWWSLTMLLQKLFPSLNELNIDRPNLILTILLSRKTQIKPKLSNLC